MNIIRITAAELVKGDDNDGDIVETVTVQDDRVFITYEDDDTRYRAKPGDVYTVRRTGGISTVTESPHQQVEKTDWAAEAFAAAAEKDRAIKAEYRREDRARYGR